MTDKELEELYDRWELEPMLVVAGLAKGVRIRALQSGKNGAVPWRYGHLGGHQRLVPYEACATGATAPCAHSLVCNEVDSRPFVTSRSSSQNFLILSSCSNASQLLLSVLLFCFVILRFPNLSKRSFPRFSPGPHA